MSKRPFKSRKPLPRKVLSRPGIQAAVDRALFVHNLTYTQVSALCWRRFKLRVKRSAIGSYFQWRRAEMGQPASAPALPALIVAAGLEIRVSVNGASLNVQITKAPPARGKK